MVRYNQLIIILFFKCSFLFALPDDMGFTIDNNLMITSPKITINLYEPAFIQLEERSYTNEKQPREFYFFINNNFFGKKYTVSREEQNKILLDNRTYQVKIDFLLLDYFNIPKNELFFPEPGEYTIQLAASRNRKLSNKLVIKVTRSPDHDDKQAGEIFSDRELLYNMRTSHFKDESIKKLTRLTKKYPNSIFAPYAHYSLLKWKYKQLIRQNLSKDNLRPKRRDLANQHSQAKNIPAPSEWHADALLMLANCKAYALQLEEALTLSNQIIKRYQYNKRVYQKASKLIGHINKAYQSKEMLKILEEKRKRLGL